MVADIVTSYGLDWHPSKEGNLLTGAEDFAVNVWYTYLIMENLFKRKFSHYT